MDKKLLSVIKRSYNSESFKKNPTSYFYNISGIAENVNDIKCNAPSNMKIYYAMKANNHSDIMDYVKDKVDGIEIASNGELQIAKKYVLPNQIIFTGPGKTDFELREAIVNKIRLINVESVVEAIRINNIAALENVDVVDILLRINLNACVEYADEKMSGISTKMGIDENEIDNAIEIIKNLPKIKIVGIHVFAASGVLDYKQLIKVNTYIFELVKKLDKKITIDVVDFGGGFGIDYSGNNREFNVKAYFEEFNQLTDFYHFTNKEFLIELGTFLVGNIGYYTAKIIDIKFVKGKKHIIIAGGVNHMGLPLEMQRKHPIYILRMGETKLYKEQVTVSKEVVDISGPLCMVTDKLSWNQFIEKADIGDIVVYRQAGAYCYGEGMVEFLSHEKPNIVIIKECI